MSAVATPCRRQRSILGAGMDGFIVKPVGRAELLESDGAGAGTLIHTVHGSHLVEPVCNFPRLVPATYNRGAFRLSGATQFSCRGHTMARPLATRRRTLKTCAALGLTVLMAACSDGGQSPVAPPSTPAPAPAPIPPPRCPAARSLVSYSSRHPVDQRRWRAYGCIAMRAGTVTRAAYTDATGAYRLEGAPGGVTLLWLSKDGYKLLRPDLTLPNPNAGWMGGMHAIVNGDTQFDVEIVPQ